MEVVIKKEKGLNSKYREMALLAMNSLHCGDKIFLPEYDVIKNSTQIINLTSLIQIKRLEELFIISFKNMESKE
jgi:hypothetical protein